MAPILYDTRRLRLVDSGTWWLSETPTRAGSKGWDASSPRIVTWAMLEDRVAGEREGDEGQGGRARRKWLVLNTHFDHIGAGTSTCTAERESFFVYSVRGGGGGCFGCPSFVLSVLNTDLPWYHKRQRPLREHARPPPGRNEEVTRSTPATTTVNH
jgi:hypothetical protein